MVTQAVAPMEPVGALVRAIQWLFRAHENGNVRAAKFRGIEGVARGLLNGNVSGNRGDCQHAHVTRTKRHDQSHGVIGSSVGINQEKRFHAA